MEQTQVPSYIKTLHKPHSNGKSQDRRVWGIELGMTWVPYFTATNAVGITALPSAALGAPLRLRLGKDGSVQFSKAGRPALSVASELRNEVKLVQDNFIAELQAFSGLVQREDVEAYAAQVQAAQEAGAPIVNDAKARIDAAIAEMAKPKVESTPNTNGKLVEPSAPRRREKVAA